MTDPADDPRPDKADQFFSSMVEPMPIATSATVITIVLTGWPWSALFGPLAGVVTFLVYQPIWKRWKGRHREAPPA